MFMGVVELCFGCGWCWVVAVVGGLMSVVVVGFFLVLLISCGCWLLKSKREKERKRKRERNGIYKKRIFK